MAVIKVTLRCEISSPIYERSSEIWKAWWFLCERKAASFGTGAATGLGAADFGATFSFGSWCSFSAPAFSSSSNSSSSSSASMQRIEIKETEGSDNKGTYSFHLIQSWKFLNKSPIIWLPVQQGLQPKPCIQCLRRLANAVLTRSMANLPCFSIKTLHAPQNADIWNLPHCRNQPSGSIHIQSRTSTYHYSLNLTNRFAS